MTEPGPDKLNTAAAPGNPTRHFAIGAIALALTILVGGASALQSQINGALTVRIGSAVLVTLLSFMVGTVILLVIVSIRREWPTKLQWRGWSLRRWWLFSGPLGAFFVVSISSGVPLLGVALATVLTVAGQTVAGVILDSRGTGVATRLRISPRRVTAVVAAIVGLGISVFAVPNDLGINEAALGGMIALLVFAGVAASLQQAANGAIGGASGSSVIAACVSFIGGTVVLIVATLALWATGQLTALTFPTFVHEWWLYAGGLLGALFILVTAFAVRVLGVLALALAVLAGQIVTAVVLDTVTGAAEVGMPTLASIAAVSLAVILAVVPNRRAATFSEVPSEGAIDVRR